jgi:ABC-type nickel/cobalt efflux system permease component RcnA
MLRRHAPLIIAIALIMLVATACIVRTGRPARGNSYRSAPAEKHKQYKHKKAKKAKKHKRHR